MEKRNRVCYLQNNYSSADLNHSEVSSVCGRTESHFGDIPWSRNDELAIKFIELANQTNNIVKAQNETNRLLRNQISKLEEKQVRMLDSQEKANDLFRSTIAALQKEIRDLKCINDSR